MGKPASINDVRKAMLDRSVEVGVLLRAVDRLSNEIDGMDDDDLGLLRGLAIRLYGELDGMIADVYHALMPEASKRPARGAS